MEFFVGLVVIERPVIESNPQQADHNRNICMNYETLAQDEVDWYRKHGRYPKRIARDSDGIEYVIGDRSWNRQYDNKNQCENIEEIMRKDLMLKSKPR